MKLLAFTDIHENTRALGRLVEIARCSDIELVACTGDVSNFGRGLENVFRAFHRTGKSFLFVPGNHEESCGYEKLLPQYPLVIDMHMKTHKISGFTFLGYGGGGFAPTDTRFISFNSRLPTSIASEKLVVLFHMPPWGTSCDKLKSHVGSTDYRKFVEKFQPALVICGHLHETFGAVDKIGSSVIVNPGAAGKIIDLD